jgi:hypothetical protein
MSLLTELKESGIGYKVPTTVVPKIKKTENESIQFDFDIE